MRHFLWIILSLSVAAQAADQNPSPMVEHTREHPRLVENHPPGLRFTLSQGTLLIPDALKAQARVPLLIFLHGGTWLPEVAGARHGMAVLAIQSKASYAEIFARNDFLELLEEAAGQSGKKWSDIILGGWSAGCRGIREIAKSEASVARVNAFLFIDGIHTSYTRGRPGPLESEIDTASLEPLRNLCGLAIKGTKRVLITHSEIFPGTFASTTETADWLLRELNVTRTAVLKWGPMKTQQLSEAKAGALTVLGFAGNSAPDHVDQLHALPDWLAQLRAGK